MATRETALTRPDMEMPTSLMANENEMGVARQSTQAAQEIQAAVFMARRFPRNEERAYTAIMKSCARYSFADQVTYSYPRGGQKVEGPSVYLAREMARVWGNIRYGTRVLHEDEDKLKGEAFAWDLETNTLRTAEFKVPKLIQRKVSGSTQWVKPDERDLREQFANIGARYERECVLKLMPSDFVQDAIAAATQTIEAGVAADPELAKKQMLVGFQKLSITPDMLQEYLGHPVGQCSPKEITDLRQIWKSIAAGEAKWADFVKPKEDPTKAQGSISLDAFKPSADANRGHDAAAPTPESGLSPDQQPPAPTDPNDAPGRRGKR